MKHELKCWPAPFEAIRTGAKTYEVRRADRPFAPGHELALREWDPDRAAYTGRTADVVVLHVTPGGSFGLPDDLCVMGVLVPGMNYLLRRADAPIGMSALMESADLAKGLHAAMVAVDRLGKEMARTATDASRIGEVPGIILRMERASAALAAVSGDFHDAVRRALAGVS